MSFSVVVTLAVVAVSVLLGRPIHNSDKAMVVGWFALGLSLASLLATWTLLAALVERRPVWADPLARGAWLWAVASCLVLGGMGVAARSSQTMGAALLYGAGMSALGFGAIGLTLAALPRRAKPGRGA